MAFDTPKAMAKALAKADTDLRQLDKASIELGATLVGLARTLVPYRSGRLQGTIAFRIGKPSKRITSSVTVSAGGARAPYASPIHWGWPRRHIDKQPFLMDALGRMVDRQLPEQVYGDRVVDILTKAMKA